MSPESKYKGQMSYWVVVVCIGMIIVAILLSILAFSKDPKEKTAELHQ